VASKVIISRTAERELKALSSEVSIRIGRRLVLLAEDPHPAQSTRLRNSRNFRLRVGDYRVVYSVDDSAQEVTILGVGHRGVVYRDH
jgi:mRNA interferase RelE/StbE